MNISEHIQIQYYIAKSLEVSTAHIRHETSLLLENNALTELIVYKKECYGWIVDIPDYSLNKELIPEDLILLIKVAKANGCDRIELDCDGPMYNHLPQYEW